MAGNRLELGSAIDLVAAVVADRAQSSDLRVLFVKGPFFAALGLRSPKDSLDLDVLLTPRDVDRLARMLGEDGWSQRDDPNARLPFEEHSATLVHPFWPCSIDVHRFWLGLLGDAQEAFEHLWSRHVVVELNGVRYDVPCREDATILLALNEIRGGWTHRPMLDEVVARSSERWGDRAGEVLRAAASELSAELTAAPFLAELGEEVPLPGSPPEVYREWMHRLRAESRGASAWLLSFDHLPLRLWPRQIIDALALRPSQLRALRPDAPTGPLGLASAWFHRIAHGVRGGAHAVRALAQDLRERRRGR